MIKTVKVSEKGQIAIPQIFRMQMGINQGDDLFLLMKDNHLIIEKIDETEKRIVDDFKDVGLLSDLSLGEIWDNSEDDIWESCIK